MDGETEPELGAVPERETWPAVVVGAGAAGLLTALFAARGSVRVLLLETRRHPGAKIRVSGGGRCNILPSQVQLGDFHTSGSRHTLRNILFSWPLPDVREFFEVELGIPLEIESTGKIFPASERPQDVVEALMRACTRAGVVLRGNFEVVQVQRIADPRNTSFELQAAGHETIACRRLVLATGGLSLPKTGSDGGGLQMAHALGIRLVTAYPALVPLRAPDARWRRLPGVSLRVRLRAVRGERLIEEREGDFLFTHRGFSGPVVLDCSRHVTSPGGEDVQLVARWGGGRAPDWETALRPSGKRRVATLLGEHLPDRLVDLLLELSGVPRDRRESELDRAERQRLVSMLDACPLPIEGSEGYATAEVTGGGVALDEISPRTLESRSVPGLYFAGEMLDAIGRIGGYNFLWAWTSGRKVGLALASNSRFTESQRRE